MNIYLEKIEVPNRVNITHFSAITTIEIQTHIVRTYNDPRTYTHVHKTVKLSEMLSVSISDF